MPWGRIDDRLWDHEKAERLGARRMPALGLLVSAVSWSNYKLTDGFVPTHRLATLCPSEEPEPLVEALVESGLWEPAEGGYSIHDFLVYNESRADVIARRTAEAERARNRRAGASARTSAPESTPTFAGTSERSPAQRPPGRPAVRPPGSPARSPGDPSNTRPVSDDGESVEHPSSSLRRLSTTVVPSTEVVPARTRNGAAPGEARPAIGSGHPVDEVRLTARQASAWTTWQDPAWERFRAAWLGRGLRLPPRGEATDDPEEEPSQRALLYEIAQARPIDLGRWVRDAPAGAKANDVIEYVLGRWHALRAEVGAIPEPRGMDGGPNEEEAKAVLDAIEEQSADDRWAEFG